MIPFINQYVNFENLLPITSSRFTLAQLCLKTTAAKALMGQV